jgi:hypothetical protein
LVDYPNKPDDPEHNEDREPSELTDKQDLPIQEPEVGNEQMPNQADEQTDAQLSEDGDVSAENVDETVTEPVSFPEAAQEDEIQSTEDDVFEEMGDIDPLEEANRLVEMAQIAYRMEWRWASFELYVISPTIEPITPPLVILQEPLPSGRSEEFVYPILDYGFKMSTSKASDMFVSGMSMCKLFFTIEKMIYLLIDRLKSGGIGTDTEVRVAFSGFSLAQRKAFESIINLSYNVVVTNFEPGDWGEHYLQTIKRLADKGYGYPPEAPRDIYKRDLSASVMRKP